MSHDLTASPKTTILVAGPDPGMLRLIQTTLGEDDYHIVTARSGSAALESAERERPALAIVDARLPDMDGLALVRRLRAKPATRHTRLILLTGAASVEERERGYSAGVDAFLTSPFSPLRLLRLIEEFLGR